MFQKLFSKKKFLKNLKKKFSKKVFETHIF
jgi:hypothetical protein